MTVRDKDMLRHEVAHAIGALHVGALAVKITIDGSTAEALPAWPDNKRTDEQHLASLIAGRAFVVEGMDLSVDDAQIAEYPDDEVHDIAAHILPIVADRLECVSNAQIDEMLATLKRDGALMLTPSVVH